MRAETLKRVSECKHTMCQEYSGLQGMFHSDDPELLSFLHHWLPETELMAPEPKQRIADLFLLSGTANELVRAVRRRVDGTAPAARRRERPLPVEPDKMTFQTAGFEKQEHCGPFVFSSNGAGVAKVGALADAVYDYYSVDDFRVIKNLTTNSLVISDSKARRLHLFQPRQVYLFYDALSVYINVLLRELLKEGWVCFHGAAAAKSEQAVVFLGGPGSGKTTSWLHLVLEQGFSYLENDILFMRSDGDRIYVRPWNRAACFGVGTLKNARRLAAAILPDPGLLSSPGAPPDTFKYYACRSELQGALRFGPSKDLPVAGVVLPALALEQDDSRIQPVPRPPGLLDRIVTECVELRNDPEVYWFDDADIVRREQYADNVKEIVTALLKTTPCCQARIGRNLSAVTTYAEELVNAVTVAPPTRQQASEPAAGSQNGQTASH
jgi:hypothetical protein